MPIARNDFLKWKHLDLNRPRTCESGNTIFTAYTLRGAKATDFMCTHIYIGRVRHFCYWIAWNIERLARPRRDVRCSHAVSLRSRNHCLVENNVIEAVAMACAEASSFNLLG